MTQDSGRSRRVRTLIYGSCVSRDTFEHLTPAGFHLITYVARQGMASAFSENTSAAPAVRLDSAFQARMVANDWAGSLPRQLKAAGDGIDLILWDLCDERLGLYVKEPAEVFTRSVELLTSGFADPLPPGIRHVQFGSEEHFEMFVAALARFRILLDGLGLLGRLLLVAPPWAAVDEAGNGGLGSFGRTAEEANALFPAYERVAVEILACPLVGTGRPTIADSSHKWGRSPFHYSRDVYERLATDIKHSFEAMTHSGTAALQPHEGRQEVPRRKHANGLEDRRTQQ